MQIHLTVYGQKQTICYEPTFFYLEQYHILVYIIFAKYESFCEVHSNLLYSLRFDNIKNIGWFLSLLQNHKLKTCHSDSHYLPGSCDEAGYFDKEFLWFQETD